MPPELLFAMINTDSVNLDSLFTVKNQRMQVRMPSSLVSPEQKHVIFDMKLPALLCINYVLMNYFRTSPRLGFYHSRT
jgi:hypothetical protein